MKTSLLTPNLERRLNTLISLSDRKKDVINIQKPTVTLSREYGCEAFPLAQALIEKLNESTKSLWTVYDKDLIREISINENLSESFLNHIDDTNTFSDFMASFNNNQMTHDEAYNILKQYIAKIAIGGNAIIVGRGSHLITSGFENCLHFRIEAPLEVRVESIAKRLEVSESEAKEIVKEGQEKRTKFYMDYFDKNPCSIDSFHAIFNGSKLTVEEMASTINTIVTDYIAEAKKKS